MSSKLKGVAIGAGLLVVGLVVILIPQLTDAANQGIADSMQSSVVFVMGPVTRVFFIIVGIALMLAGCVQFWATFSTRGNDRAEAAAATAAAKSEAAVQDWRADSGEGTAKDPS